MRFIFARHPFPKDKRSPSLNTIPARGRKHSSPSPGPIEPASPAVARFKRPCIRERDDAYPSIIRVGDVRVIECRDRLQWIWQRRQKSGRWVDLGYFRNRDVLIERSGLAELRSLPPYHVGGKP
jgi:hypothetical protein